MCDLKENDDEKEKVYTGKGSDVCEECGGRGVIEHPCMRNYYSDCPSCSTA